jgi:catechol 2,3-dioxygenase-like lactoylglutathione lyase family enzyme
MAAEYALNDVTINVRDRAQARAFYHDLLGFPLVAESEAARGSGASTLVFDVGNGHRLRLHAYGEAAQPSAWQPNDLHVGYRHLGFVVQNTDATTARLKAANVPFTLNPLDATGGVRIAFFKDPDGTLLEVVQGTLTYHQAGAAPAPVRSDLPQASGPGELVFDHIAISVADLDQALNYYCDTLGFQVIGQLFFHDARGFTITYLRAGLGVVELFSFSNPTTPRSDDVPEAALGIQRIGFAVEEPGAAGRMRREATADADGNPIELIRPA